MAKTKKVKKIKNTPLVIPSDKELNTEVKSLMGKSRVWVGLAIVLLVLGTGMYIKNANSKASNSQMINLVSPQPTVAGQVASPTPTAKPTAMMKKVATLADTNGKVEVTVQGGDSFWKISERVCGTGKYFLDIQSALGYTKQSIHPGDKLIVQCPN